MAPSKQEAYNVTQHKEISMRCKACNKLLTDAELNKKTYHEHEGRRITVWLDLCGRCHNASTSQPGYLDREWEGGDVQSDLASLISHYRNGTY